MYYNKEKDYSCGDDTLEFFFSCMAYFNHYGYFTHRLWKKVKGFENEDEAEVKCAFLSLWTKNTLGITTYPVGCAWCAINGNEEFFNSYVEKWKPVFEDFDNWCAEQR